jgi:hypothetical protein
MGIQSAFGIELTVFSWLQKQAAARGREIPDDRFFNVVKGSSLGRLARCQCPVDGGVGKKPSMAG